MDTLLPFLPKFAAAYAILLVAASSPGPAVAMLLGVASTRGRRAALTVTTGIAAGSVTINLLTLVGLGLLLSQIAWAMTIMRMIGAAYLAWLAIAAFRKALNPPPLTAMRDVPASPGRLLAMGYLLQVTNPKAIVFWLAIASVGATHGGGAGIVALFALGAFLISFGCHGAWALLLSSAPVRAGYTRARRWVEGALGAFFAFAAFKIATSKG
ncbi:LysE family translocator [Salipiger abyssi]|uniref:LysE family translocator n=1 Tax=Salipiger abyssi TaxID=1250539 RepID=UPI001A8C543E|nr:LysE family translocator [Salipiger abyssi]MBN9886914.1 LysE family translocator [Salipiger abyssi]